MPANKQINIKLKANLKWLYSAYIPNMIIITLYGIITMK